MNFKNPLILLLAFLIFLISGCSTPTYRQVFRERDSGNSRDFAVPKEVLYNATLKALYSNNFIIEDEDVQNCFISGKRSFQRGSKTIALLVQGRIVNESENSSKVYLNAVETTEILYVCDRTRYFLFIIPLPGGGGKEARSIKQKERAVRDRTFYKNFFTAIEKEIL